MIVEFDSREALDVWLKEEPFLKLVFMRISILSLSIKPFLKDKFMRVVVQKLSGHSIFVLPPGLLKQSVNL